MRSVRSSYGPCFNNQRLINTSPRTRRFFGWKWRIGEMKQGLLGCNVWVWDSAQKRDGARSLELWNPERWNPAVSLQCRVTVIFEQTSRIQTKETNHVGVLCCLGLGGLSSPFAMQYMPHAA